jgi:hypothetical protein
MDLEYPEAEATYRLLLAATDEARMARALARLPESPFRDEWLAVLLCRAVRDLRLDLVRFLVHSGAPVDGYGENVPLLCAVMPLRESGEGRLGMLEFLLESSASPNIVHHELSLVALTVVSRAYAQLVILLLYGADPWAPSGEDAMTNVAFAKLRDPDAFSIFREFLAAERTA